METLVSPVVDLAVVIGFVNAVGAFSPTADSRLKLGLATVAALFLTFVPIGPQLTKVIDLLFGSSGLYKGLQVVGAIRR